MTVMVGFVMVAVGAAAVTARSPVREEVVRNVFWATGLTFWYETEIGWFEVGVTVCPAASPVAPFQNESEVPSAIDSVAEASSYETSLRAVKVPVVGVRVTVEAAIVIAAGENVPSAVAAVVETSIVSVAVVTASVPFDTCGV